MARSSKENTRICDNDKKSYKCRVCGESFITSHEFEKHSCNHNNMKESIGEENIKTSRILNSKTQCKICLKTFKCSKYLKKHSINHTREERNKCQICDKFFKTPTLLESRLKLHNTGYKCKVCSKAFNLPCHLKNMIWYTLMNEYTNATSARRDFLPQIAF